MRSFRRVLVWLSRCNKCRGFGVQSPWAYQMIRYVINEHWPYYAYDDFDTYLSHLSDDQMRLGKLYFRLSNFRQAEIVLNFPDDSLYDCFFQRGCRNSDVRVVDLAGIDDYPRIELLRLSLTGDYESLYEKALAKVDEQSVIIIENIHTNKACRSFWKRVTDDERVRITFDLFDCGIIFFQNRRYKENYIVNF